LSDARGAAENEIERNFSISGAAHRLDDINFVDKLDLGTSEEA
jgi:hypothetical protein